MKTIALLLVLLPLVPQEKEKPCDLTKLVDGFYCIRCKKILLKDEKKSDLDKDGNCLTCSSTPDKAKVCLKEWVPRCGMHDMQPHDKCCCSSKMCCKLETLPALVSYKCEGCDATASFEDKIVHKKTDHDKKAKPVCGNTGRFPHGGELPKKDPPKDAPPKDPSK